MKIRRATIVALAVLPFAAIQPAQAETATLAPPFHTADHWSYCSTGTSTPLTRLPAGSCTHTSDASEGGLLSVDLSMTADERLPTSGSADGQAGVRVFDWLGGASIVLYTVTYEVSGAHASADSDAGYIPLVSYGRYADTTFSGSVSLFGQDAYGSFSDGLSYAYVDNHHATEDGTFTRRMILASEDGSAMEGPVSIDFALWGYAEMGPSTTGGAAAGATVRILSLTSEVIA